MKNVDEREEEEDEKVLSSVLHKIATMQFNG
jgi:hypothetical protein